MKHRKETEVPHTEKQTEEGVPTTANDPLPSGDDRMQLTELMNLCTNIQKLVFDLEKAKTTQAKEIVDLKKKGRMNGEEMFGVNDLDGDEVIVDATTGEEVEHSTKVAEKEVSTADPVKLLAKHKGKGIMVEPKKHLKKKDQIAFDEEVIRKLEAQMKAEMKEEKRIAREKDEANIAVIEQ
nr:hypothetical protein [Tanacetum cinerariifolium]